MHDLLDLFHKIYNVQGVIRWGGLAVIVGIVFAETGLLVGFFLPGDSLLVTAGIFCTPYNPTGAPLVGLVPLLLLCSAAAIVGDTVGYFIGKRTGPRLFAREDSLLFHKKHLFATQRFYEKHGGKTIILARFMPIVRTFAPVVAGIGQMQYRRFVQFNVVGGIGWVFSMALLGYGLASAWPGVTKQIDKLIVLIIFLSLLPGIIGWWRSRGPTPPAA